MFGFISGARYWFIILAVASAVSFGSGYLKGESHAIKVAASATASVGPKAAKAQAAIDLKDRQEADTDQTKRKAADDRGQAAQRIIYRDRFKLVPGKCIVPKAAMKRLNDPALIGEQP